jgi:hypothetical protein
VKLVSLWAQLTKIYPPPPTSVLPISITKTLLIVPTKNERDDFHFCRSRVIGLGMTENRIFTLCRMITWVVFLRMFWNFISSLPVKRGGSLSLLLWAQLTKIYPLLPTSVQPISITKTLLIVPTMIWLFIVTVRWWLTWLLKHHLINYTTVKNKLRRKLCCKFILQKKK